MSIQHKDTKTGELLVLDHNTVVWKCAYTDDELGDLRKGDILIVLERGVKDMFLVLPNDKNRRVLMKVFSRLGTGFVWDRRTL